MNNRTLIQKFRRTKSMVEKADLILADLQADGGYLLPEQAKDLLKLMIKQSVLLKQIKVTPMSNPKRLIETFRFGSRVLKPASSGTELSLGDRSKPDFGKAELDPVLCKGEVRLDDETLEDNIERGALRSTVMSQLSDRIATDMEELVIQGDILSADPYLALFDGLLKQAASNVVDAGGVRLDKVPLKSALKSMPSEFVRDRSKLAFFTSLNADTDYRDTLSERATPLGDVHSEDFQPVRYNGVAIQPIPMFPENLGVGTNMTNVLFTDPKNVWLGIRRQIQIEIERLARAGSWAIIATVRFHALFAHEPAAVKVINVLGN